MRPVNLPRVVGALIASLRGFRRLSPDTPETLKEDPLEQFEAWLETARRLSGQLLPEAMCLSTVGPDGRPEGRMVLLKGTDRGGFVFYTSLLSQKGRALEAHPRAALTFHWERLGRQVRVVGSVGRVSDEEADAYFASRPRGSQLAAWASRQSAVLPDRKSLLDSREACRGRFRGRPVPRPPAWTGFRVKPDSVEFWQLRPSRFHDRFLYTRADGGWKIERLSP